MFVDLKNVRNFVKKGLKLENKCLRTQTIHGSCIKNVNEIEKKLPFQKQISNGKYP